MTPSRTLRHRMARHPSPHRALVPVVSPYLDRLRAAAVEPCWRTTPEGRALQAHLARMVNQ